MANRWHQESLSSCATPRENETVPIERTDLYEEKKGILLRVHILDTTSCNRAQFNRKTAGVYGTQLTAELIYCY